jgi:hypothetical protein
MNTPDEDDAATRRALHHEMLVHLMYAVKSRRRSVESERIFVLLACVDVSLGQTQPLPRCA